MVIDGYAGKILIVDLSSGRWEEIVTADIAGNYLGGKGMACRLFWELARPEASASDPENCLVCATGPVTGFHGLAGCRWVIYARSPSRQPEMFSGGNLGGRWGPALKAAGYDALVIRGRSERPACIYVNDETVQVMDASHLQRMTSFDTAEKLKMELGKGVSVLAIGPAAESGVVFATALAEGGASVAGGMGAVLGSKNLKAIVVSGDKRPAAARPEKIDEIKRLVKSIRGPRFDGPSPWAIPNLTRPESCYGCGIGCSRQSYRGEDGRRYKSFCQASSFYTGVAIGYYGQRNDVPLMATRLCDGYGLDTTVMGPLVAWLIDCYRDGIISEASTGLPLAQAGSREFIEALVRKISHREGLGEVLAQGTPAAAAALGSTATALLGNQIATSNGETRDYDPRLIPTAALLLATESRRPVSQLHGISGNILISWTNWARGQEGSFFSTADLRLAAAKFWGGEEAVDFSTWKSKALAAKKVQDRSCAQESLVLCDVHWPMVITSADCPTGHIGDPSLESQIYTAITNREMDEAQLSYIGERIFNLQRAIMLRHGRKGRDDDTVLDHFFSRPLQHGEIFFNPDAIMPGPGGRIISRIGAVLDRNDFEQMREDYYRLRGWDTTGLPKRARLVELGLDDIAAELGKKGLVT